MWLTKELLEIFSSVIHDTIIMLNTHSLAALVTITQEVVLARPLGLGNSNLWSRYHWRMSLHLLCQTRSPNVAQEAFYYCVCTIQRQPDFTFTISNSILSMQRSLLPVYHVLRTGRFPRVQPRCKSISSQILI